MYTIKIFQLYCWIISKCRTKEFMPTEESLLRREDWFYMKGRWPNDHTSMAKHITNFLETEMLMVREDE